MDGFQHFILTNFNVRRDDYDRDRHGSPVLTRAWMEERFVLFENFCLPSVRGQTNLDFTWLVRHDEETPAEYRRRLDSYKTFQNFELVPARLSFKKAILQCLRPGTERIVTTRLDNDDALHRGAIALLQSCCTTQDLEFLNLPVGYCYAYPGRETYLVEDRSNAFLSLVERITSAPPRTAVCINHNQASEVAPVRQIGSEPSWLQVIHTRNLRNRPRGVRCTPERLEESFSLRAMGA